MSVAIGIDLGTTNTVVAAVVDGVAVTLEDENERRLLPSVVSFHPSGTVLAGEPARERRTVDPENTIFSVKPLLGRSWGSEEVEAARRRFPFQLVQGNKNSVMVRARDVDYALPEISAFVLRRAKAVAEAALGQTVERAVITVPANFNDLQRASTKIAGKLAGLEVMRILNEPTAAALAYGQSIAKAEKIGVYDLGGGTFDITLLDLTGNVFEVLATAGDTALGGDDVDRAVADKISVDVLKKLKIDPRTNPALAARLTFVAEELKKELSRTQTATRDIRDVGHGADGKALSMNVSMTREELEAIAQPLIARTIDVARQSIESVGLSPRDFDRVILVGGSTRMPLVGRMVEQLFGQPPHLKVNPDEVVALGAAIQAHALNRSKGAHKRTANDAPKAKPPAAAAPPPHAPKPPPVPAKPAPAPPAPAPGRGAAPPAAGGMPEFITFNKAPAVISFGSEAPKPAPASPAKPPPVPARPPPVPKKRVPTLSMEETPLEVPLAPRSPSSTAPKPARSVAPPAPEPTAALAPPLPPTLPELPELGPERASEPSLGDAPEIDLALPSGPPPNRTTPTGDLGALSLSNDDFLPALDTPLDAPLELDVPLVTPERFAQGSAIATSAATPLLIDVTPLSLGVETVGGYTDVLIPANSPVPCEKTRIFRTASDHQTVVSIRVAQGESAKFAENTRLGDLELSGLRDATRGDVKIAVTFELDADGILNVRAKDPDTGRETAATMRLLGTATDVDDIGAMAARQARHAVA